MKKQSGMLTEEQFVKLAESVWKDSVPVADTTPYYAALTLCRHCGYEWSAVFPVSTPATTLECPKCRLQESEPIRYYPPEPYDFVPDVAEWHGDEETKSCDVPPIANPEFMVKFAEMFESEYRQQRNAEYIAEVKRTLRAGGKQE